MERRIFEGWSLLATVLNLAALVGLCCLAVLLAKYLKRRIKAMENRRQQQEDLRTLGENIRFQREQQRMTQEFVAEKLGVSRQAVSKWESGKSDPSTGHLMALAALLDVAPEEMLRKK